jgi:hypothetical protein
MSTLTFSWHGTGLEAESLLEAVEHNCACEPGVGEGRASRCSAHQMLLDDSGHLTGCRSAVTLRLG